MSWPLTRPFSEAELYKERLDEAMAANPGAKRPTLAMMRHSVVYDTDEGAEKAVKAAQDQFCKFANLFQNLGDVKNGFPGQVPLETLPNQDEFKPEMLKENLMFGTPDEVISKLKRYEALGVDAFIYYASLGLDQKEQKRSLELFCSQVMPEFA
jgi:alkanesulfonate monooxygenase SsuD/methylene tetrahydromethanopterin reductase-like flavin-dependent oxidoreductase (luciferase family)